LVVLVGLAIDQIAQSGLSSLSVIYYSAQLFRGRSKSVLMRTGRTWLFSPENEVRPEESAARPR
ncbi:hypothetical protein, partial [Klebsiella pneumoniae]|uniref:hypothetical protein n=1 Tax=Klebsiella pneumoniae TaxID=573 RepID=UPI001C6FC2C0